MRDNGELALYYFISDEKIVKTIEKLIYNVSENDENKYKRNIYQVITDINNGLSIKEIENNLKKKEILWKHFSLNNYAKEEEEQDDFIINPFQVEEGVVECRCGSKRVYSYSKQTRSGDEGITSFHQCLKCKAKWRLNT